MASSFEHLRDFILKRMRMSHIYQPVMIRELLKSEGKASIRNVAAAFLSRDESQLEHYEQITKDMPGKVLGKHGIVERDGDEYRLTIDPSSLSSDERDELVRLCDEAISVDLEKRGTAVYDHRRAALGYLSVAYGLALLDWIRADSRRPRTSRQVASAEGDGTQAVAIASDEIVGEVRLTIIIDLIYKAMPDGKPPSRAS